jgi:acetyltransferase-like isoleucine patch superfamily enzyme
MFKPSKMNFSSKFVMSLMQWVLYRKRQAIKNEFDRTLPVGDLIIDRWNTARFNKFGIGTTCYSSVLVIGTVSVGDDCWIGPNVLLDGSGVLTIGNRVQISAGAQIYTHDSVNKATSIGHELITRMPTTVGDNVYIGPNAIVQRGVTIGNNAIIGALSLVNQNVPPGGKYLGTKLQE